MGMSNCRTGWRGYPKNRTPERVPFAFSFTRPSIIAVVAVMVMMVMMVVMPTISAPEMMVMMVVMVPPLRDLHALVGRRRLPSKVGVQRRQHG